MVIILSAPAPSPRRNSICLRCPFSSFSRPAPSTPPVPGRHFPTHSDSSLSSSTFFSDLFNTFSDRLSGSQQKFGASFDFPCVSTPGQIAHAFPTLGFLAAFFVDWSFRNAGPPGFELFYRHHCTPFLLRNFCCYPALLKRHRLFSSPIMPPQNLVPDLFSWSFFPYVALARLSLPSFPLAASSTYTYSLISLENKVSVHFPPLNLFSQTNRPFRFRDDPPPPLVF